MSDGQHSLHLEIDAKLGVSLFNVPIALQGLGFKNCDRVMFRVSLFYVSIALQSFRLTTPGCRVSLFTSLYRDFASHVRYRHNSLRTSITVAQMCPPPPLTSVSMPKYACNSTEPAYLLRKASTILAPKRQQIGLPTHTP